METIKKGTRIKFKDGVNVTEKYPHIRCSDSYYISDIYEHNGRKSIYLKGQPMTSIEMDDFEVIEEILVPVSLNIKITKQDIEDIVVGSFEGGSDYWIANIKGTHPSEEKPSDIGYINWAYKCIKEDGHVDITPGDNDDLPEFPLNVERMVVGINMFLTHRAKQGTLSNYINNRNQLETGQIDAGDCDGIIQYAIFGEWVYG